MALEKTKFIWKNGKLVNWDDAQIHVLTHGLHYGSAVFEGIRFYQTQKGPAIFRLQDHVHRLFESAKAYEMQIPFSEQELCQATISLVRENKIGSGYIRPIVFYGYGKMGLNPQGAPLEVAIACWPWGAYLGEEGAAKGIKCITSKWKRINSSALPSQAKACGQYLNSILASLEAHHAGADEAVMLNSQGLVAEGPGENLFLVKNGAITTPPLSSGILKGITRESAIEIAGDLGFKVLEKDAMPQDLFSCDELFFTGTAAEITPIRELDGRQIGEGRRGLVTEKIQSKYADAVRGKAKEYEKWLTYV